MSAPHMGGCLCAECERGMKASDPEMWEARKRVARRHRERADRNHAAVMAANAGAAAKMVAYSTPEARAARGDCVHCGAEWGPLCPCTPEGGARLEAWAPGSE